MEIQNSYRVENPAPPGYTRQWGSCKCVVYIMPAELQMLEAEAKRRGIYRSHVVQEALALYYRHLQEGQYV